MDQFDVADIKGKLDFIIDVLTKPKAQTPFGYTVSIPEGPPKKQWEIELERKGWTKEVFAKQIKQREPGWPESLVSVEGCWSEEKGGKPLADMIAQFKADNPELFER